jgi:hypothetical protein
MHAYSHRKVDENLIYITFSAEIFKRMVKILTILQATVVFGEKGGSVGSRQ